jgi:hypothetical protein
MISQRTLRKQFKKPKPLKSRRPKQVRKPRMTKNIERFEGPKYFEKQTSWWSSTGRKENKKNVQKHEHGLKQTKSYSPIAVLMAHTMMQTRLGLGCGYPLL